MATQQMSIHTELAGQKIMPQSEDLDIGRGVNLLNHVCGTRGQVNSSLHES